MKIFRDVTCYPEKSKKELTSKWESLRLNSCQGKKRTTNNPYNSQNSPHEHDGEKEKIVFPVSSFGSWDSQIYSGIVTVLPNGIRISR